MGPSWQICPIACEFFHDVYAGLAVGLYAHAEEDIPKENVSLYQNLGIFIQSNCYWRIFLPAKIRFRVVISDVTEKSLIFHHLLVED